MLNKKGYATLTTLIIILAASSILLLLFYKPILNTTLNVAQSSKLSTKLIKDNNAKERLYSLLYENVSYENNNFIETLDYVNEAKYEDLDVEFMVKTIDEEFIIKELNFISTEMNKFTINNETDIKIELIAEVFDPLEVYSYDVELILNNEDIFEAGGLGLQASSDIIIPANNVYNKETGIVNYGEYELRISNTINCVVKAVVVYNKLDYRKLSVKTENLKKTVIIEIAPPYTKTIKFE